VRALLDRPIAAVVSERLRRLGNDALSAADPALAALDDAELFAHAGRAGRVLVSQNVGDHLPLAERAARQAPGRHPGLIVVSPVRYPRSPLVIDRLVRDLDAVLSGHDPQELSRRAVHWLEAPPGCPFWPAG